MTQSLGRTELQVTKLGFGAMELRGPSSWRGRELEPRQAESILNEVLDAGINFIDTSIDYGDSEELIGKHISHRRSEYYLASKCGCMVGDNVPPPDQQFPHLFTQKNIVEGVEQSLNRMHTEYLDIVQLHGSPSKDILNEHEVIQTLLDLRQQGKIRFIGTSSTLPHINDHIDMDVFDTFQIPYSAIEPEHSDAITKASKANSGTIIRGGIARGYTDESDEDKWDLWNQVEMDDLLDGASPNEFILRFTITHPCLDTTIVGTSDSEHLRANLKSVEKGPLPNDIYTEAIRRLTKKT